MLRRTGQRPVRNPIETRDQAAGGKAGPGDNAPPSPLLRPLLRFCGPYGDLFALVTLPESRWRSLRSVDALDGLQAV